MSKNQKLLLIDQSTLTPEDKDLKNRWLENKWSISYSDYLLSNHWQRVKAEVASESEGRCRICSSNKGTMNTHHRDYKHFWSERWCDVIYLCRDCHLLYHNKLIIGADNGPKFLGEMAISLLLRVYGEHSKDNKLRGLMGLYVECTKWENYWLRRHYARLILEWFADIIKTYLSLDSMKESFHIIEFLRDCNFDDDKSGLIMEHFSELQAKKSIIIPHVLADITSFKEYVYEVLSQLKH